MSKTFIFKCCQIYYSLNLSSSFPSKLIHNHLECLLCDWQDLCYLSFILFMTKRLICLSVWVKIKTQICLDSVFMLKWLFPFENEKVMPPKIQLNTQIYCLINFLWFHVKVNILSTFFLWGYRQTAELIY